MILKNVVLTIFLMVSYIGSAQVNLNEYKYIIVPKKFDDFKLENQHQTSTLVKHLFTKKGFTVIYDDNLPADLKSDRCLGLMVGLLDNSSMFTTKTALELKDCNNKEVFISQQGKSKKKDYRDSYAEAINNAFNSFATLNYSYEPKEETKQEETVTVNFSDDVKKLEERPNLKRNQDPMVEQIATEEVQYYKDRRPVETDFKKADSVNEKNMVDQKATKDEQSYKSLEPVQTDYKKAEETLPISKISTAVLYAQELPNGYQLVDSTPKIRLKIFKSSMPNVYIAKADSRDGVVYTSDGKWFFEYHEGAKIFKQELNIKF